MESVKEEKKNQCVCSVLEWFRLFVFLFFCIVSILQFGLFFRYDSRFPTFFFVLFAFVFEIVMLVHEGLVCFYLICLLYCVFVVFFSFFFYPKLLMYLCFLCRSLCSSKVARNRVCLCYQRAHFVDFVDFVDFVFFVLV